MVGQNGSRTSALTLKLVQLWAGKWTGQPPEVASNTIFFLWFLNDETLKILDIITGVCQERRYNFDLEERTLFWSNGRDPWHETPPSLGRNSGSKFMVFSGLSKACIRRRWLPESLSNRRQQMQDAVMVCSCLEDNSTGAQLCSGVIVSIYPGHGARFESKMFQNCHWLENRSPKHVDTTRHVVIHKENNLTPRKLI